jgi:hypothetical protein
MAAMAAQGEHNSSRDDRDGDRHPVLEDNIPIVKRCTSQSTIERA